MSRRTLLLILAILAALAVSSLRLTIERRDSSPWVGDFPSARRSSRGPVPVSLPFVVGLVVPSVQARRRAMQAKHRERLRALRQYRAPAWFPARRSPRRYGLPRQRWQVPAPTARALGEPLAIERQPPASTACHYAVSARPRGHNPGTRETDRARQRFSRPYRGGGHGRGCTRRETPCLRGSTPPLWRVAQSLGLPRFGLASSDERHRSREDFDDHGPHHRLSRRYLARQLRSLSIEIIPKCCQHGEHEVTTRYG